MIILTHIKYTTDRTQVILNFLSEKHPLQQARHQHLYIHLENAGLVFITTESPPSSLNPMSLDRSLLNFVTTRNSISSQTPN